MFKLISSIVAVAAIGTGIVITYKLHEVPETPNLDFDKWWGIGLKPREEDTSIRHFKIDFNDSVIQDLKQRLKNRRPLTKPLEGIHAEYGINTVYLEKIVEYWLDKYDFKKRADFLNKFPHFKTRIQGLDIHFIRVKPDLTQGSNVKVLPLLLLHGWPSSSKEFDKIIPVLATQRNGYDFVFEIVSPDLPGFGFSEGTNKPGLSPVQIGIMMRNLMRRLGFKQFYIHAGDWGSHCATHIATLFPEEVLGYHTNMPMSSTKLSTFKLFFGSLFPSWADPDHPERIYPLGKYFYYMIREGGYFHMQATKPDTVGVALTDSPVGLAGYLIEKIAVCCNRNQLDTIHGGLENNIGWDDLLDTISIVWINNCAVTSMRIYAESVNKDNPENNILRDIPTKVPMAAIKFLHEVVYYPDWLLKDKFPNMVRSTAHEFGGHFAALQTPQVLVDDILESVKEFLKFNEKNKKL